MANEPETIGSVARRLGVSEPYVRRLDGLLKPERTASGIRLYETIRVEALARLRERRQGGTP